VLAFHGKNLKNLHDAIASAPRFKKEQVNGVDLISWLDQEEGRTKYAALVDESTLLMSNHREPLLSAATAIADPERVLTADSPLVANLPQDRWVYAAGLAPHETLDDRENPVLREIQSMRLEVYEQGGNAIATMTGATATADAAETLATMASGFKGFISLAGQRKRPPADERARLAAELANATTVNHDRASVVLTLSVPADRVVEMIDSGELERLGKK
jgi:hypothetical protein